MPLARSSFSTSNPFGFCTHTQSAALPSALSSQVRESATHPPITSQWPSSCSPWPSWPLPPFPRPPSGTQGEHLNLLLHPLACHRCPPVGCIHPTYLRSSRSPGSRWPGLPTIVGALPPCPCLSLTLGEGGTKRGRARSSSHRILGRARLVLFAREIRLARRA